MKTVRVKLGDRSYDIRIGTHVSAGDVLQGEAGVRALVVSDTNVDPLYGDRVESALRDAAVLTARVTVPAGEASKRLETAAYLYGRALDAGLDRSSVIVALGGGMIGDLAGFVAATYMRGIRLVQIPTSLLAMVDSSVGGKTAVNLPQGKNLVGVFYQPIAVAADLTTLESLPQREYRSGLAEVVKYGVIRDEALFRRLENAVDRLLARDRVILTDIVARSCEIKAEVVAADEREAGVRAILNYGHTFGHACEAAGGYGGLLHGEAVSIGMAFAARLSSRVRGLAATDAERIVALLRRLGLPVAPCLGGRPMAWPGLRDLMIKDKKTHQGEIRYVLGGRIGSVAFGCPVGDAVAREVYESMIQQA